MLNVRVVIAAATVSAGQEPAPPRFQSSVDLASVDVNVVDGRGQPITDLGAGDFVVRVDGQPRRVVSAEWVSLVRDAKAPPAPVVPEGYSTNEAASGGRLIVIAVDQPNIRPGRTLSIMAAASAFIDKLSPADRVAIVGFGAGAAGTRSSPIARAWKQALTRMVGQEGLQRSPARSTSRCPRRWASRARTARPSTESWLENARGARAADAVALCRRRSRATRAPDGPGCDARSDDTVRGLRDLFIGLKAVAGPKTLILISEGFLTDDTAMSVGELGALAAASRTSLYAVQLDDTGNIRRGAAEPPSRRSDGPGRPGDAGAGRPRGAAFRVTGSAAGPMFDRIEAELSGYYLLAVESEPRDRDGKAHPIRVDVTRSGALVRARRQMLSAGRRGCAVTAPGGRRRTELAAPDVGAAPAGGDVCAAGAGTRKGPAPHSCGYRQRLQRVEGGVRLASRLSTPRADRGGSFGTARWRRSWVGVPSSLEFVAGASLPPGDYTLRLAAAEGDRAGSVEHPIHAALVDAGNVALSALMVGGLGLDHRAAAADGRLLGELRRAPRLRRGVRTAGGGRDRQLRSRGG